MYSSKPFLPILATFSLLFSILTISDSTQTPPNLTHKPRAQTQTQTQTPQNMQPTMTFLIQDILTKTPSNQPTQTTYTFNSPQTLPFSKPLTNLPFSSSQTSPYYPSPSTQTLGVIFSTLTTTTNLDHELELGPVTDIEEDMYETKTAFGAQFVGKAKGIYVGISNGNGVSHMMALTVRFSNQGDSLRLFGVHKRDVLECHVAVIGGTGKFEDANGYATIRIVTSTTNDDQGAYDVEEPSDLARKLLFNVYLS